MITCTFCRFFFFVMSVKSFMLILLTVKATKLDIATMLCMLLQSVHLTDSFVMLEWSSFVILLPIIILYIPPPLQKKKFNVSLFLQHSCAKKLIWRDSPSEVLVRSYNYIAPPFSFPLSISITEWKCRTFSHGSVLEEDRTEENYHETCTIKFRFLLPLSFSSSSFPIFTRLEYLFEIILYIQFGTFFYFISETDTFKDFLQLCFFSVFSKICHLSFRKGYSICSTRSHNFSSEVSLLQICW